MEEKTPLVSVVLATYNQELYVEEALKSLIYQSYNNIEIIISDDASTDKTVEIISKLCELYVGDFNIIFNKNTINLGIARNFEKALSLCSGEYIALSAGDDISCENRVSKSLSVLTESENSFAIFSELSKIDRYGNYTGKYFGRQPNFCHNVVEFLKHGKVWSIGASLFFDRILIDQYGRFLSGTYQEDGCLAFRAILSGGLDFINEELVNYRVHEQNASQGLSTIQKVRFKEANLVFLDNMMKDYLMSDTYNDNVYWEIVIRKFKAKVLVKVLKFKFLSASIFWFSNCLRKVRNALHSPASSK